MASMELSLGALTVSRQRASGILLKKWCTSFRYQVTPMSQVVCLIFKLPGVIFRAQWWLIGALSAPTPRKSLAVTL